jgi:hypothetical protein
MPTQPFQREHLYCCLDRHRVRFLGFGNYGVPLLDQIVSDLSIEEGHSTTSIDRFGNGFTPSQASSFVRVERTGNAHPTRTTLSPSIVTSFVIASTAYGAWIPFPMRNWGCTDWARVKLRLAHISTCKADKSLRCFEDYQ